jgi:hypothetical protein
MTTIDNIVNDSAISSEGAPAHVKQCKTTWYSKLKEDPEVFAIYKEKVRLRNETRANAIKELEEIGVVIDTVKKVTPHKKIDPEIKKQYNMRYYSTHREQVIKYVDEYVRNEYAKESSTFVDNNRKLLRKRYHEVVKNSPEQMERQRIRARQCRLRKREHSKQKKAKNTLVTTDS